MSGCDFVSFASSDTELVNTVYYCILAYSTTRSSLDHVMSLGVRLELFLLLSKDSTGFCVFGLCLSLSWSRLVLT